MGQLSGSDIDHLSRTLTDALSFDDLAAIVYASTGDQLFEAYVGPGRPLRPTVRDALIEFEKLGLTAKFLAAVHVRRPHRPDVQAEIERLCPAAQAERALLDPETGQTFPKATPNLAVQRAGAAVPGQPQDAFAPGLQKNVRPHLAKLDVHVWLEKLARIERQVCRIEIDGNALGTGFLVGSAAVLTNWHVAEVAVAQNRIADIVCRFDYLRLSNGSRQPGIAVALSADGCVDFGSYSAAEKTGKPDEPPPTADELDYALLQLVQPIGEADAGGAARGWIALPAADLWLEPGAPLLIVQHPDGAPMKLALDTDSIVGANANRTRLRYRTNTEGGSSGSPCFSMDWDLVALHHYGDPAWQQPLYNQGVPIGAIRRRIAARGHDGLLGI